jgi:hypothetical protein
MVKFRVIAGAVLIAAAVFCGASYGWTGAGSWADSQNSSGNYPLGMPLGGIGAGNFNLLPDGTYNQQWVEVSSDNSAYPTLYRF